MCRLVVPTLAVLALAATAALAGLVQNPDFSANTGAAKPGLVGWTVPVDTGFQAVNDDGRSGHDSLRYKAAAEASRAVVTQEVTCQPNTEYVLTAAFKVEGALHPCVSMLAPGGDRLAQALAGEDRQWTLHSVTFNTREATKLRIEIDADALASYAGKIPPGTCWVDDVDILTPAEARAAGAKVAGYGGPPPGENLALHCPYTLAPAPTYAGCTDPDDKTQLTDGAFTVGYFWTQKTTVGYNGGPVTMTLDLGKDQPIKGAMYSTAAGVAGVAWPASILLFVSDDGQTYYGAGDLVTHAAKFGMPEPQGYSTFRFVADDLNTHGRYIRLVVASSQYIFCDEVEAYKGPDALLTADRGKAIADTKAYMQQMRVKSGITARMQRDLRAAEDLAAATKLSAAQRAQVSREIEGIRAELAQPVADLPVNYRAVYPLTPLHARILALTGAINRMAGRPALAVWQKCRWDLLQPTEQPPTNAPAPALSVAMMGNEYRAEALNVTNLGPRDLTAHVRVTGLPGGDNPDYVTVHQVEFTECQAGLPLADALPAAPITKNAALVSLPAGMTRQVWLTFNPRKVPPGTYKGQVRISEAGPREIVVPLTLRIYPFRMPEQPTCSLGMWDYTDGNGAYGVVPTNITPAIADMRAHFVDTPWAGGGSCPWPGADAFDANDKLVQPLNFTAFDTWLSRWPGSRHYALFISVGDSLAGTNMGDPHFQPRTVAWLQAIAAHVKALNLKPEQFYFLIWDEPYSEDKDLLILTWARAFHASGTGFQVWEDPMHAAPEKSTVPEMFEACDVICPQLSIYATNSQASRDFYEALRQRGKKLWFYQCSGPARLFDPVYYHRYNSWYVWQAGGVGGGFWSYGDTGGAMNSWNEFLANGAIFTPEYLDETSTTTGKHWEAVREGIEDYEYFAMLRSRVEELEKAGKASPLLEQAKALYTAEMRAIIGDYQPAKMEWKNERDRTAPDRLRVRILDMLDKLGR